jgi:hypothetical protein
MHAFLSIFFQVSFWQGKKQSGLGGGPLYFVDIPFFALMRLVISFRRGDTAHLKFYIDLFFPSLSLLSFNTI